MGGRAEKGEVRAAERHVACIPVPSLALACPLSSTHHFPIGWVPYGALGQEVWILGELDAQLWG